MRNSPFPWFFLILMLLTLMIFIWGGFLWSCSRSTEKTVIPLADYSLVLEPTTFKDKQYAQLDSIVKIVNENQQWIIRRQETLVNDIRQETNNTIDKLALWSGVAICLVSFFGCLVPIWQNNITRHDLEKSMDVYIQNLKRQEAAHQLYRTCECITLGLKSKQVDNNASLRLLTGSLLHSMCSNFSTLVGIIKKDMESKEHKEVNASENRIALLHALIEIDEVLRTITVRMKDSEQLAKAQVICDDIRRLVNELANSTFSFNDSFMNSLNHLVRSLELFRV